MTRVLGRGVVEGVLDVGACLGVLREGFLAADGDPGGAQRVRAALGGADVATVLLPGRLPGIDAYTVKVNAKFPAARPALRGVVCLHDARDGALLALLDSATVTAWRTGLAAALGTDALAPPGARTLAVVGAGAQAELTLRGLRALRPGLRELLVHDIDPARAEAFAARHGGRAVASPAAAAARAEAVLLATWAREPLLAAADLPPDGRPRHLTSLGADEPGKRELAADLQEEAFVVVDDRALAERCGTGPVDATLAEVLRGRRRPSAAGRTVYAPVGLPWQDLALAWTAYRAAERLGLGTTVDLLA
ncbi:ornithine cyclodeaminase [Mangrovactinospora gilvigrisea]|uniref:Ornithine cyclodeaminase n=1 Tax=Mangrovactinospora gilvigrisea TaxID=1428644 RepID=A0A1J7C8H9_9ACTN|nr:ornithine cyclodeaminase family protein [Mangrovactinospora gilvigrisea]OIV35946.1 ornithine cyclodeaminase [Mangrovactinospora gilvigrisea]